MDGVCGAEERGFYRRQLHTEQVNKAVLLASIMVFYAFCKFKFVFLKEGRLSALFLYL